MATYELKWVRSSVVDLYEQKAELEKRLDALSALPSVPAPTPQTYTLSQPVTLPDLYKELARLTALKERLQ